MAWWNHVVTRGAIPIPFGDSRMFRKKILWYITGLFVLCSVQLGCSTHAQTGQGFGLKISGGMEVGVLKDSTLSTASSASSKTDNEAMVTVSKHPSALSHKRVESPDKSREEDVTSTSWETRF